MTSNPPQNPRRIKPNFNEPNEDIIIIVNGHYFKPRDTILSLVQSIGDTDKNPVTEDNINRCNDKTVYVIGSGLTIDGINLGNRLFQIAKVVHYLKQF